ncbi:MAG: hypothetical protein ACYTGL_13230 [Planctomycetota bacterium]|jgi:hypothetical protein
MAGRGRGSSGDPDFGSDSFLDIVANLVGILIILIVLAGLRASQAPLQPDELPGMADAAPIDGDSAADTQYPADAESELPLSNDPAPSEQVIAVNEPVSPHLDDKPIEPLFAESDPETVPAVEIPAVPPINGVTEEGAQQQLASLNEEVRQAAERLAELDVAAAWNDTKTLQRRLAESSARLRSLQSDVAKKAFLAEQDARLAREADAKAARLRVRLEDVNRQLEQLSQLDTPDEPIEIRINPIGRRSTGDELWFVVEDNKLLRLPVGDLFQLMAGRERGNGALMLRAETQRGVVGPVDGVSLEYEIGMQIQSTLSPARGAGYRNSIIMHGVMHPARDAPREPIEQALAEGGVLSRTLLQTARGSVVRLSVATDSFAHARRIAAFCRDLGFLVSMNAMEPGEKIRIRFGSGSDAVAQ